VLKDLDLLDLDLEVKELEALVKLEVAHLNTELESAFLILKWVRLEQL
jgi:hypothetical protein